MLGHKSNRMIGEALKRSAASFDAANTSLEKSVALVTATNTVVQDPSSVGTLWKTLSARIRGAKTELEELGEEEDEFTQTTSKLRDMVKALTNFDIMENENEYKDIYDIILGIGKEWDKLSDIEQASLGEALAGKRNANALFAVLNNIETLEAAYDTAKDSANSAAREQENYAKSVQYSLDRFQASIEQISYDLLNSGLIKGIVESGVDILGILDKIIFKVDSLPALLAGIGSAFGTHQLMKNFDLEKFSTSLQNTQMQIAVFNEGMKSNDPIAQQFVKNMSSGNAALDTYLKSLNAGNASLIGYGASLVGATVKTIALQAATMALHAALTFGISLAVTALISGITHLIRKQEEAIEELDDLTSKYNKLASEMESHKKTVDELSDSYYELTKGVDSVSGKNISLSTEDYKEFVDTNQKLAEMFPSLISGIDEYGNYIINLGDNADEARKKLQDLLQQEQENYNYELYKDLDTVQDDIRGSIKDAQNRIATAEAERDSYKSIYNTLNDIYSIRDNLNEPFELIGNINDEDAKKTIEDFIYAYQNALNFVDDQDMASHLRDAFVDESVGNEIKKVFHLENLSAEEKKYISSFVEQYTAELLNNYDRMSQEVKAELTSAQHSLQSAWLTLQKNIIGGINFLAEDEKTAEVLTKFVNSLPAEVAESLKDIDLQSTIAQWVSDVNELSPEDKLRFNNLFDPELSPEEKVQLWKALQEQLPPELEVYVKYVVDKDQDLVNRVNASKNRLATRNTFGAEYVSGEDMEMLDAFFEEMQIDTEEEYEKWLEVTRETENAIDACDAYRKSVDGVVEASEALSSSIIDSVEGINKRLKSQFDELGSLYKGIFYNDKGFSLADIDNEQLEALKKAFIDLEDEHGNKIGASFKGGEEAVNKFIDTLTSAETKSLSVAQQQKVVQKAFNDLATAYFYSADGLKELNEETKDALAQQFSKMGITNADEVIDNAINTRKKLDELITVEDNPNVSAVDDIKEAIAYSEEYVDDLDDIYKQYNAINNVDRDLIVWDDENLEKYKDFLTDFYDGDYEAAVKDLKDTWSTVLGTAEEFDGIQIAYTQMLQTDHGLVPLTSEQFSSYFNSIIQKATNKDGTIDADKLVQLDTEGVEMEINGQVEKVYGLIAAAEGQHMGDIQLTADDVIAIGGGELADEVDSIFKGFSMHDVQANALFGDYKKQLEDLEAARESLEAQGKTLEEITQSDIKALLEEGTISEQTAKQLEYYVAAKAASNGNLINTDVSCEALYALAKEAGLAAAELEVLNEIMGMFDQALAYEEKGAYQAANAIRNEANNRLTRVKQLIQEKVNENLNIDFSVPKDDASKGGKEAADAWVEAYEKGKEELQSLRDAGLIDESTYLERLKVLIDKFFKDRAKYAKNYIDEMKEYLDGMKSLYDSAISGVTTLIDKKIDAANKGKDAAVKSLEKEKEAAEEAYQAQIDALQAQIDKKQELIDKINEANEARDHEMALQKAQYELERSLNQRTRLVYTGEPGQMRYERDESAVREAREGVQDAEDQLAIDALEKEIKLLEKQKETIEKTMESTSKYYEKLIKQQEEYWDALIEGLEKQKSKWEELAEIETIANAYSAIEQVFGPLGYTVEEVLGGSEEAFEDFKNKYIQVLRDMNTGNQPFLDGLNYATGAYKKSIEEISGTSTEIKESMQKVSDATAPLSTAADNVKAVGDAAQTASSGVGNLKTSSEGISDNLNELQNVDLTNVSGAFKDLGDALDAIKGKIIGADSIQSAIEAINDATLLTGLAQAFTTLGNAVGVAAAAIGGGGADAEETYGGAGQHGKNGMPSNISANSVSGGTGEGLIGAINGVKTAADGSIGTSLEEAEGTAIGDFNQLGTAITSTSEKIGVEDSAEEGDGTLIGNIVGLQASAEEHIPKVIDQFDALQETLAEVAGLVGEIAAAIAGLDLTHLGGGGGFGTAHVSTQYTGTAQGVSKASGDWGVKKDENALVGELGQELLLRNGTYHTLGDRGPEFVKLRKGDVVLNHLNKVALHGDMH